MTIHFVIVHGINNLNVSVTSTKHTHTHTHIYIYIEREREIKRESYSLRNIINGLPFVANLKLVNFIPCFRRNILE